MSKESITDQEQIFIFTRESAFVNNEEAFALVRLI